MDNLNKDISDENRSNRSGNRVQQQERGGETRQESIRKEIFSWILTFTLAILAAFIVKNFLIINADVPTGSMENTIMPGDRLIGNRLSYIKKDPARGDIVIFHFPDKEEDLYVKRVIGLPGETVFIENAKIYIDGSEEPLQEDYLKEEWTVSTGPYSFQVPEDCYLVLGDNRNDSYDARYWVNTYVKKEKILGKGVAIYWPVQDIGKLK